jgi:hypothetical protein
MEMETVVMAADFKQKHDVEPDMAPRPRAEPLPIIGPYRTGIYPAPNLAQPTIISPIMGPRRNLPVSCRLCHGLASLVAGSSSSISFGILGFRK